MENVRTTSEYRQIEWEIYKAIEVWKKSKKGLKNPHDLQNGLDIIFSINSILENNDQQLNDISKLRLFNS